MHAQADPSRAARAERVALVTGAARGLGLAIATRLARDGHPVVLSDLADDVEAAAARLQADGHAARALRLDVADEAAVSALPQRLAALGPAWAQPAILVNNAGISPKTDGRKRDVAEMPTAEWQRVLAVNLTGAFLVTRACLPALRQRGWGRVVMITSQAARTRTPLPGAHYAASKAGLTGLARVLAGEVARQGITVNCVAPGRVRSAMTEAVDARVNAALAEHIPLGRFGEPQDVAGAVAYLVSDDAAYLTGTTIDVNGGNFMG